MPDWKKGMSLSFTQNTNDMDETLILFVVMGMREVLMKGSWEEEGMERRESVRNAV